jgi:hypothetical protein
MKLFFFLPRILLPRGAFVYQAVIDGTRVICDRGLCELGFYGPKC